MEEKLPFDRFKQDRHIYGCLVRGEKPASTDDLLHLPPTLRLLLDQCWDTKPSERPRITSCLGWLYDVSQEKASAPSPAPSDLPFRLTPPARSTSLFVSTPEIRPLATLVASDDATDVLYEEPAEIDDDDSEGDDDNREFRSRSLLGLHSHLPV